MDRIVTAVTYVALRKNADLLPYDRYRALAIEGTVEHGLPDEYVERLRCQETIPAPQ